MLLFQSGNLLFGAWAHGHDMVLVGREVRVEAVVCLVMRWQPLLLLHELWRLYTNAEELGRPVIFKCAKVRVIRSKRPILT